MAKKPSVLAAKVSWWVILSMRLGKSWREILGVVREAYSVSEDIVGELCVCT